MKRMVAGILASLCCSAYASNWFDLGKSADNNLQMFLDLSSIKPYSNRVSLQSSSSVYVSGFVQSTYINNHEYRDRGWYYSKEFFIVDCANNSYYSPSYITYGFKNQVVDSYQDKYFTANDFNMAFPETIGNEIVDNMCAFVDMVYGDISL